MIVLIPPQIVEVPVPALQEPENDGVDNFEAEITRFGVLSSISDVIGVCSVIVGIIVSRVTELASVVVDTLSPLFQFASIKLILNVTAHTHQFTGIDVAR